MSFLESWNQLDQGFNERAHSVVRTENDDNTYHMIVKQDQSDYFEKRAPKAFNKLVNGHANTNINDYDIY